MSVVLVYDKDNLIGPDSLKVFDENVYSYFNLISKNNLNIYENPIKTIWYYTDLDLYRCDYFGIGYIKRSGVDIKKESRKIKLERILKWN